MQDTVREFNGEHAFLSNFYPVDIIYKNIKYESVEHAYQAQKCKNPDDKQKFIGIFAGQAKRLGRKVECRSDWNDIRLQVMYDTVKLKFKDKALRKMLLSTGDAFLIEGNNWKDTFWGVYNKTGIGENNLGAILMKVRDEIVAEKAAKPKIYFCSDLHFFHDNIITHCKRPCTVSEHTDWILNIVSKPLRDNDIMYHVGDFAYGRNVKLNDIVDIISRLKGKWKFIIGNHDNKERMRAACKGTQHEVLNEYTSFKHENTKFILCHYPIESWDSMRYGSVHIHGHLHDKQARPMKNRYNVCLDNGHRIFDITEFIEV